MRALVIVRAIVGTCSGLVAGIFLGYLASAPARAALSPSSFVQYEQAAVEGFNRSFSPGRSAARQPGAMFRNRCAVGAVP